MTKQQQSYWAMRLIPVITLFIGFLACENIWVGLLFVVTAMHWAWDFWTNTKDPTVWLVHDDSNPPHEVKVEAHGYYEAIGKVAEDTFGMWAEQSTKNEQST